MTTIGMNYDVIPGKEAEFEQGFANVIAHLKTVTGHVESRLYRDIGSAGGYLILSQWQTKESFETFLHSPAFKQTVSWGKAEILRSSPRRTNRSLCLRQHQRPRAAEVGVAEGFHWVAEAVREGHQQAIVRDLV